MGDCTLVTLPASPSGRSSQGPSPSQRYLRSSQNDQNRARSAFTPSLVTMTDVKRRGTKSQRNKWLSKPDSVVAIAVRRNNRSRDEHWMCPGAQPTTAYAIGPVVDVSPLRYWVRRPGGSCGQTPSLISMKEHTPGHRPGKGQQVVSLSLPPKPRSECRDGGER